MFYIIASCLKGLICFYENLPSEFRRMVTISTYLNPFYLPFKSLRKMDSGEIPDTSGRKTPENPFPYTWIFIAFFRLIGYSLILLLKNVL